MTNNGQAKRVAFYTLGCKVNQYDTEGVAELFRQRGYRVVDFSEPADVYVINTCTVTSTGDKKSRQAIRRAVRQNPEAVVVAMGCYSQVAPQEVAQISGVDLVVGTKDRTRIVDLVERQVEPGRPCSLVGDILRTTEFEDLPITEFTGRTRATVKVQEGCSEFCSYCKIPFARGPSRSRPAESVLAELRRLEEAGFREVVLTGIHLGAYGRDLTPRMELADLLQMVAETTSIPRLRISSVDPHEVTERLVQVLSKHRRICRHLHIPLQGGDDAILRAMRRRYTLAEYRAVVDMVRKALPDVAVTTDIIVGFPGETSEQFARSLEFVAEMRFSRLHVFRYSPRRGTPAAKLPKQVPGPVKQERSRRMIELGERLSTAYNRSFVGTVREVLLEQKIDSSEAASLLGDAVPAPVSAVGTELWEGLTDNYMRVVVPGTGELAGRLVPVRLTAAGAELALGEIESRREKSQPPSD